MKSLLAGIIPGLLLVPFLLPLRSGTAVVPHWSLPFKGQSHKVAAPQSPYAEDTYAMDAASGYIVVRGDGTVMKKVEDESLRSFSGNGKYYISYEKTGKELQLFDTEGKRYWKIPSREYPWVSRNGRLILLLNGDHSRIRIADLNGRIQDDAVHGRLASVISFSQEGDAAIAGFLDGSYALISESGEIAGRYSVPEGFSVKSVGVASDLSLYAVHFGNTSKDFLMIHNLKEERKKTIPLERVHRMKTALSITDGGDVLFFDLDGVGVFSSSGKKRFFLDTGITMKGYRSLSYWKGHYLATYRTEKGEPRISLFTRGGTLLLSKSFHGEGFLWGSIREGLVLVRGASHLSSYIILPAEE